MKRILLIFLLVCPWFPAMGQVTCLDSSFNGTGIRTLHHGGGRDLVVAALARPDGRSLEVGYSYFDNRYPALTLTTVTIAQFDANGHPDPNFGEEGVVVLDQLKTDADAADAVLQPDGKLLITGKYLNASSGPHHYVARLNEDGSLDASFGVNGVAGHPDVDLVAWGSSLALQPDGKIVMGGSKFTFVPPGSGYHELAMIRFNPDGEVDYSFGNNGLVLSGFAENALAVAVGGDSLIYASGEIYPVGQLARYLPNGALDTSFGDAGLAEQSGAISHILVQPNGQVVVSGAGINQISGFLDRFNADGSKDTAFENAGLGLDTWVIGIDFASDGKIVVGTENVIDHNLRIFRYFPDGHLDLDYDKEIAITGPADFWYGLSVLPDGKIILGGEYYGDLFADYCLLRLTDSLNVDEQFGLGGYAVKNIGTSRATASSILVGSDNRILAGGVVSYVDGTTIVNLPIEKGTSFISRILPNASLDSTFSNKGFLISYFPQLQNKLALQPDGKIISAGGGDAYNTGFIVSRSLQDGSLDVEFGLSGGFTFIDLYSLGIYEASVSSVALTPDSGIVVMGKALDSNNKYKIAIVRLDPNGWQDLAFGTDGVVFSTSIPGNFDLNAGLVQPDGKILVAGTYPSPIANIFLVRFMPEGQLDAGFGTGGVVLKPFPGVLNRLNALAIQPDGQILLAGNQGSTTNNNLIVGRLNPDGARDVSFGSDGLAILNTGTVESGNALAVQADGKVVVAGYDASTASAGAKNPMIARLLPNGLPDSSFAGAGYVVTDIPGDNQLNAMALQGNGDYITAGYSNNDYLLIRYLSKLNVGVLDRPGLSPEVLVYPNPLRGHATIQYTLRETSEVTLELYDLQGRRRQSFVTGATRPQGDNAEPLYFPASLEPGVYTLRIQAGKEQKAVRVVVAQ